MNLELLQFIEKSKKDYFLWLLKNEVSFPFCCYISSDVLGGYISANFANAEIMLGIKKETKRHIPFHAWIESEGLIIDFTRFQFHTRKKKSYLKEIPKHEAFDLCINHLQAGDVVFKKSSFYEDFEPIVEKSPILVELAKGKTLDDYLTEVLQDKQFTEYSFWGNVPNGKALFNKHTGLILCG